MAKAKTKYLCTECGAQFAKALGKCTECGEFGTVVEVDDDEGSKVNLHQGYSGKSTSEITRLSDVQTKDNLRIETGFSEMDRVLGGGLVVGSINLIGGDPGIGKSTLLLQIASKLADKNLKVLYISGEESDSQIKMRGERLGANIKNIYVKCETDVEAIISDFNKFGPDIVIIDSIQTMYIPTVKSSPGSVSQVKDSAQEISRYCKSRGVSCFLVGHITKDGTIAGPKVLEHIVDAVFYFEGEQGSKYRMLRSNKNRFGEVNEMGVFAMSETGLKEIKNPSAIFLSKYEKEVCGSALMVTKEGSRPLIIEIQVLVSESNSEHVRRICIGLDKDRLNLLMAILQKTAKSKFYKSDVYVSVVGGVKVTETASDVALVMALLSSEHERSLPKEACYFGEIGLTGEVRPIPNGEERIKEAIKHGITTIVVPKQNAPKKADWWVGKANIIPVVDVGELLTVFNNISKKMS